MRQQVSFWLGALVVFIVSLWLFREILLPFIAGIVLAYFLDPVADWFEEKGLPRLAATLLILGTSVLAITLLILLLVPVLSDQIVTFASNLPGYVTTLTKMFNDAAPKWLVEALASQTGDLAQTSGEFTSKLAGWVGALLKSILTGGIALVNMLSLLVITPIVAFYMLNDWDRMVAIVDGWIPRDQLETIRGLASQVNEAMAGFIRGQGLVCIILGLFYAITLIGAGLNFGLLIGLAAGFLSFIPYVGSIVGGLLAIGMALVQFWPDWVSVSIVAGIFVIGQFIEGNFLSPKLVGGRIGLHPVWLMFALFAFGYLFGFVGLLMAVPLAAAVAVLTRFALKQYLASKYYLGKNPPGDIERPETDVSELQEG
jgi:predicted PurR-regulated permease PerM